MMEIKGFITNLGKYNEGELVGEWITFPISEDELAAVFERIGINEQYEEFFFTDWEFGDCSYRNTFGEYENIERVNEIAEKISRFSDWEEETFKAALELYSLDEALEVDNFNFYKDITNDYDLGYYWAVESGCYDIDPKKCPLLNYIDYEAFGRDIRLESDGGFTSNGWIEIV